MLKNLAFDYWQYTLFCSQYDASTLLLRPNLYRAGAVRVHAVILHFALNNVAFKLGL